MNDASATQKCGRAARESRADFPGTNRRDCRVKSGNDEASARRTGATQSLSLTQNRNKGKSERRRQHSARRRWPQTFRAKGPVRPGWWRIRETNDPFT
jgi:hypothetical protein